MTTPPAKKIRIEEPTTPNEVPPSPIFELTTTVPRKVWQAMQGLGAQLRYIEGVVCVYCVHNDEAFKSFAEWTRSLTGDKDPGVQAILRPQPRNVVVPLRAVSHQIVDEANEIIAQYSHMRAATFRAAVPAHPAIRGSGDIPNVPIRFSNAAMATHAVTSRVANPALGAVAGAFPAISAQAAGTYLCTILQSWKGRMIHIDVFRS